MIKKMIYLSTRVFYLLLFVLFTSTSYADPFDFSALMDKTADQIEDKANRGQQVYISRQEARYRAVGIDIHDNDGLISLADQEVIDTYVDVPDAYNYIPGNDSALSNIEDFNKAIDKAPTTSGDTIYSAQKVGWNAADRTVVAKEGNYIVNSIRPMSFSENPHATGIFLKDKLANLSEGEIVVVYTVNNPKAGRYIAPISYIPAEAEVSYPVGSSFKIRSVGDVLDTLRGPMVNISLQEVEIIPEGSTIYHYKNVLQGQNLTAKSIANIPESFRIKIGSVEESTEEELSSLACMSL